MRDSKRGYDRAVKISYCVDDKSVIKYRSPVDKTEFNEKGEQLRFQFNTCYIKNCETRLMVRSAGPCVCVCVFGI